MGYVGKKPTDAPLTSSDIGDGQVTAAKLGTDAVETAKVKDLNVTVAKLPATVDVSSKTVTLPASVGGLGTGIDVTSQITGVVPSANLGSGTASSSTVLYGDGTYKAEPTTDLTPVNQDILTLALRNSIDNNDAKYNLPNSAITHFESDADYDSGGSTNIIRNASEYLTTAYQTAAQFTSDSNTLVLYHFDGSDTSTTFTDSSSHSRTLTAVGNAQLDTAQKKFGTASLLLDGTGDACTLAASADWVFGTGDFTYEWWCRFNAVDKLQTMIMNGVHDTAPEIWIGCPYYSSPNNYVYYEMLPATGSRVSPTNNTNAFVADTWYHVAVTRDGANMRHYIDGVQIEAVSCTGSFGRNYEIQLGKRASAQYVDGWVDEFRISDTCRYTDGTTFVPNQVISVEATGTALGTTNVPTSAVTDVSGVMLLKDAYGSTTLGTDVKVYFTADN